MSTKVFVGNLAFRTTDQNLVDLFGQVGQVKSASIITRGRRSLGYGFVELASADAAIAAVNKFNNSTLLEREIKVEVAKELSERPPRPAQSPKPRAPRAANADGSNGNGDGEGAKRAPRRRGPKPAGDQPAGEAGAAKPRAEKKERAPRPERPKVQSDTTLFVANLPFSIDDAALLAIFAANKAKTAHVVRTRNDRSRGYGFVEFGSKADQQAALASKNNAAVAGDNGSRNITVTVSTSAPPAADAAQ